ncbi:hypothetical protein SZN_06119 [Streptomyces zinciresistens K42]|uniref:Copper chaperone PCu(A)C n=1 Tax=Streptomyces zinciresistens K42 TaxID=700597 RepID=G2G6W6_9ACTN|nr:copper chaperone PCu(A)C [Streptomyces zinciresistens]EGX60679.1 hypothetical protein SZN_06119 [Streptomyces zinciresistens K42]
MKRFAVPAAALTGALLLAGCGSGGSQADLSVSGAYMRQPVSDTMAAGFLTITNKGGTRDKLTSITSDLGVVTMNSNINEAMRVVKSFDVPARGRLVFASGGNHLMFEKLTRKPKEGETVTVRLNFTDSKPVSVRLPVKSTTYSPKTGR